MHALGDALDLAQLASARNDQRDQRVAPAFAAAADEVLTMAELAGGRAPGRLVLTTYHSAEGREFSAVILPGLVEGPVPFYFASRGISACELARARRLFYVAVTRARDAVVLIPGNRFSRGARYMAPDGRGSSSTSNTRSTPSTDCPATPALVAT